MSYLGATDSIIMIMIILILILIFIFDYISSQPIVR